MKAFIQHSGQNTDKAVLQALVPFMTLKDSVVFTNKSNPNGEDKQKSDISESSYQYYQRRIDMTRIRQIEDFIIDSILDEKDNIILATLFPSSMILAINDDNETTSKGNEVKHIEGDSESCELSINNNVFIVDGQHRMMAMRRVYERLNKNNSGLIEEDRKYVLRYIENYKFNCVILVNYDLWEQGQVFVNVNFKQKPVNKSLYYEIFGSKYSENKDDWKRNTTYLAHCMAKTLNEHTDSPYRGQVKMLGTGKGFISQAFIVESLLKNFRKNGIWEYNSDESQFQDSEITYFATEILSYWCAIKELFPKSWPSNDEPTIICKSTAFGAFVRLMGKVRTKDDYKLKQELQNSALFGETCREYIDHAKDILSPLVKHERKLFGKNSEFSSTSGQGSEGKLYKRMKQILENSYTNDPDFPEILDPEDISMQLQEYFWSTPIDDLDPLAHSNEVEEINDLEIVNYKKDGSGFSVHCSFKIEVTLYIDNEDEHGFSMEFPAECKAFYKVIDSTLLLDEESVSVKVNTDEYYK